MAEYLREERGAAIGRGAWVAIVIPCRYARHRMKKYRRDGRPRCADGRQPVAHTTSRGVARDELIANGRAILDACLEEVHRLGHQLHDASLVIAHLPQPVPKGPTRGIVECPSKRLGHLVDDGHLDAEHVPAPTERRDECRSKAERRRTKFERADGERRHRIKKLLALRRGEKCRERRAVVRGIHRGYRAEPVEPQELAAHHAAEMNRG